MKPYIIAEIGSNWCKFGDKKKNYQTAHEQIKMAKRHGASAVKFQLFTCEEIYGQEVKGTIFEQKFDTYALPQSYVATLADTAKEYEIDFLCSAFSVEGFKFVDNFVPMHKLASCEITDKNITDWLRDQRKPVIYSDGCINHNDFGRYIDIPMRCVTKYPAQIIDYDLSKSYVGQWGLSDHTKTIDLAIMCLKQGARYFEKHVDFFQEFGTSTPDTPVSIGALAFENYAKTIREYDFDGTYKLKSELNKKYARIEKHNSFYRPIPETANLNKVE